MPLPKDEKPFDLYELKVFMSAVSMSSYAAAGAEHGISQSAVSMVVSRLEKRVGKKLLEKSGRSTEVTKAGSILYAYSRTLLLIADDALAALLEE